jgi:hypothetical protein
MSRWECLTPMQRSLSNTKLVRPAGLEPARPKARDFKSRASTDFAMGARLGRHCQSSHAGAAMASVARAPFVLCLACFAVPGLPMRAG